MNALLSVKYNLFLYFTLSFEEDSEKKSESQMGFEPTTLRDLVGCSNHLSYWRLYGEQGPILWVSTGTASRGYTVK